MRCRDRLSVGRCNGDVLPGMTVCVEHASHEAIKMRMRQMAAVEDAARVALDKLCAHPAAYGTPETKAARQVLAEALGVRR